MTEPIKLPAADRKFYGQSGATYANVMGDVELARAPMMVKFHERGEQIVRKSDGMTCFQVDVGYYKLAKAQWEEGFFPVMREKVKQEVQTPGSSCANLVGDEGQVEETNKRQKKSGEKQVVDTDYLYGSWMKDKK